MFQLIPYLLANVVGASCFAVVYCLAKHCLQEWRIGQEHRKQIAEREIIRKGEAENLRSVLKDLRDLTSKTSSNLRRHTRGLEESFDHLEGLLQDQQSPTVSGIARVVENLMRTNKAFAEELTSAESMMQVQAQQIESCLNDALTDELTGLANRRLFSHELALRFDQWVQHETPFSLIMLDVDYFKELNDTHGHQAGDLVLSSLATAMQSKTRDTDLVVRYGGDEFSILLRATRCAEAKKVAEGMRRILEQQQIRIGSEPLCTTVSLGVATVQDGDTSPALVQRADAALYASKRAGRNCSHFHDGERCEPLDGGPQSPRKAKQERTETRHGQALKDDVTGLASRPLFCEHLHRRLSELERYDTRLSIMLLAVDDFEQVSARGPRAGAVVLKATTQFLKAGLREADIVARLEGAKFGVLLPCTAMDGLLHPAHRIQRAIAACEGLNFQVAPLQITASIGIAEAMQNDTVESLLDRAEQALQRASVDGNGACAHDGHVVSDLHLSDKPPEWREVNGLASANVGEVDSPSSEHPRISECGELIRRFPRSCIPATSCRAS